MISIWGRALLNIGLRARSRLTVALATAVLAGCAADRPDPTPLEAYEPKIVGRQVWERQLSGFNLPLVPAVREGVFFVADGSGAVLALQADDGAVRWRVDLGEPLSAGVGSDGRYASVVTRGNEVVVLDQGRELWRKRVASTVVTPPLVAGERVFVMGVDRVVHAFDVLDGRRLWTLQRPGDALTLSQASVVTPFGNSLLVAQAARLAAVDPLQGLLQWEVPMSTPRGTNEVERLADLVGPAVRVGDRVCARAFQSAVACADGRRGALLWSRTVGGGNAVAADQERVYGADASDRITAWRADNGDVAWTSERMLYRGLSGPLAAGPVVVFGDREGWVHFLSTVDGATQLRLPTDSSGVVGTPALSGSTMLVMTRRGGLYAFRPQ